MRRRGPENENFPERQLQSIGGNGDVAVGIWPSVRLRSGTDCGSAVKSRWPTFWGGLRSQP